MNKQILIYKPGFVYERPGDGDQPAAEPTPDLLAFLDTDRPTEDDIEAAAAHFHVNVSVVKTLRRNKGDDVDSNTGMTPLVEWLEAA